MLLKKFKNAFWFVEKHCKSEIWTLELILVMHFKYYKKLLHTLPLIQVWPFRQLFCPWLVDLASSLEDLSVFSHFLSLRHQCAWNERIAPSVWAKIQICCPCQLPTNKQKKIVSNCSKRQRCISSISRFLCHSCSYFIKIVFCFKQNIRTIFASNSSLLPLCSSFLPFGGDFSKTDGPTTG